MELDRICFKVDKPNAKAMISGYYHPNFGGLHHQAIYLAVIDKPFPMLISLNRSPSRFQLSYLGGRLMAESFSIRYRYMADLDAEYYVRNDIRLRQRVCSNGLFDIWDPRAPYSRFAESGSSPRLFRILLLRVYEINEEFRREQVVSTSTRIDRLVAADRRVTIRRAVIPDEEFRAIKALLIESIEEFRQ